MNNDKNIGQANYLKKKKSGDWIPFEVLMAGSDCGKIQQMLDKINQTIMYISD